MGKAARDSSRASSDAHAGDAPLPDSSLQKRGKRDLLGCLTCRVRRKKCMGPTGDDDRPCISCQRNSLGCLGYSGASPPWAGRSQLRLRECSLRSKLWIELSKGASRPSQAVLDLSLYKQPDLSLILSTSEIEILNALEWQAYLHAPDKEKIPSCPRPDFCQDPLTLDQMIHYGLLQVINHEQFPHIPYDPHTGSEAQRRKRKGVAQLQAPPVPVSRPEDVPADSSPHIASTSNVTDQQDHEMSEISLPQRSPDPRNSSPFRLGAGFNSRLTRTLPPPTRQSLTDSVDTPVSGLMRRRGAMSAGTLDPDSHFPPHSSSIWQPGYLPTSFGTLGGLGQRGEQTLLGEDVAFPGPSHPIPRGGTSSQQATQYPALPHIRQLDIGMEYFRSQPNAHERPPQADMLWSGRPDNLARSSSPRGRSHTASPSNSASPSPSPSEYSRESTPQHHRASDWDRNRYAGNPSGMVNPDRIWGLNAPSNLQHETSFTHAAPGYLSAPPFLSNYVDEGIAPHEQAPQAAQGRPFAPSGSRLPTRSHTLPQTHSLPSASRGRRSPSPRELRLLSFEPFLPDERTD